MAVLFCCHAKIIRCIGWPTTQRGGWQYESGKTVCGGGQRRPAGGGRPGFGTGGLCGERGRAGGAGRLHPAAAPAGREPYPAGRAFAGRKARGTGAGRQAFRAGKGHRAGSGRGTHRLLCPAGADRLQCHPHCRGLHRHPAGRAHPHPVGREPSAAGFRAGGTGAGGAPDGAGHERHRLRPPRGTAGGGRELWSAGGRAFPVGCTGPGL